MHAGGDRDRDWMELSYEFDPPEAGPAEMIHDVRANRSEAWFDAASARIEVR